MIPTHASFLNGNRGWKHGAILCPVECVHGDWIGHCHRPANQTLLKQKSQSLNQQLSPAVPSACNQPGNRFTWNYFVGTGKLRCAAFYKAWWISEKIVFASLTGNLTLRTGSYDFFFSVWGSTLWDRVYLNFSEEEIKFKRSYLIQVTWPLYFTIEIQANFVFHQSIYF